MPVSGSQNADDMPRADEAHAPRVALRVNSPASLLAAIPITLRFQPNEPSIVVLGLTEPRSKVGVSLRYGIASPDDAGMIARHATGILAAQRIKAACAVGYGAGTLVTPVADALRAKFAETGIAVVEFLRAQDGRYWSYLCADPGCCPPDGTTYDLTEHPITRQYASEALTSREALAAILAPVTGRTARSMRKATRTAEQRTPRLAINAADQGRAGRRALLQPLLKAVADAINTYRAGGAFESHEDAAYLALALTWLQVRDDAWARMLPEHRKDHLRLWTDLTTLAPGRYAVAPAALLAFVAWQDGDGALANVALDRALAVNPRYSMATLLRQALDSGAPPSMARLPMTPEEVAAAYDHAAEPGEGDDAGGQATIPDQAEGNGEEPGEDKNSKADHDTRAGAIANAIV
jgi:hypothetical protein